MMGSLAIQFNFRIIARIAELKDFMWSDITGNNIRIQVQILKEQTMNDSLTFNTRIHQQVDHVKGNTSDGFRNIPITPKALDVLRTVKEMYPSNEFIFMDDETTYNYNL